jgi:hypothetical protein
MAGINWKYISFLVSLVGLYILLLYFMPRKFNWLVTLYQKDKDPFGAFVFKSLLDNSWIDGVNTSNKTLYELHELEDPNLLILCEHFAASESEIETLLEKVNDGKTAVISAHRMDTILTDLLSVKMNQVSFDFYLENLWEQDSIGINFVSAQFDMSKSYWLPLQLLPQYFESFDPSTTEVIAENTDGKAVLLNVSYGEGNLLLSSTPLAFSNFSMLRADNHEYVAGILSYLQRGSLYWTEYYQLGRMEAGTPLRYVLSEPSLKWAFYILMFAIITSMVFEVKRKQRIIPVISPLRNETLDFVKTISRLYYQKKDHKDLAAKKMMHFMDHLKQHLYIDINDEISEVISKVTAKTGSEENEVKLLFDQMSYISNASYITARELKLLLDRIDKCLHDRMSE